jgi:hypothetical protein
MDTTHYNHTLTIFFIAYAMFEALANFLLKKLRPSIFIPTIMCVSVFALSSTPCHQCFLASDMYSRLLQGSLGTLHAWHGLRD